MKTVILAGGAGTRLAEETGVRPKPMVEIGGRPLLWHIMGIYASHGFDDFVVACGYKGEIIRSYFSGNHNGWKVSAVDTGLATMTAGRLRKLGPLLGQRTFMLTYGDGVADVDIKALTQFHRAHGKLATVTAVQPPPRFGGILLEGDRVARFTEKPQGGAGWINGGFFVFEAGVFDYLGDSDATMLEREPLERLAADGELMAYRHEGFWQPMDTLRERQLLESLWNEGRAPWKLWP